MQLCVLPTGLNTTSILEKLFYKCCVLLASVTVRQSHIFIVQNISELYFYNLIKNIFRYYNHTLFLGQVTEIQVKLSCFFYLYSFQAISNGSVNKIIKMSTDVTRLNVVIELYFIHFHSII